jgi:hypothetical protein
VIFAAAGLRMLLQAYVLHSPALDGKGLLMVQLQSLRLFRYGSRRCKLLFRQPMRSFVLCVCFSLVFSDHYWNGHGVESGSDPSPDGYEHARSNPMKSRSDPTHADPLSTAGTSRARISGNRSSRRLNLALYSTASCFCCSKPLFDMCTPHAQANLSTMMSLQYSR